MHNKIEVGQLYQIGRTHYQEGVRFDFFQSGPTLVLYYRRPTEKEIENIRTGKIEIGLCTMDNVLFPLFKFGQLAWVDAPYSVHISKPFEFEEITEGMGFSLTIVLVDAANGVVKAIRTIGLSTEFSISLKDEILRQKELPFDRVTFGLKIQDINSNYSTVDLVQRALIKYKHKI